MLDPVYEMAVALTGVDDPWGRLPVLSNIIMAFNISVPMVLYMRYRRHAWRAIVEMAATMILPAALTMGPYLLGIMTAGTMMSFSHGAMIPLMAVAMMLRFANMPDTSRAWIGRQRTRARFVMPLDQVSAILACALLAGLAVFQGALITGAPLRRMAWGGQHRVLPANLRIGSAISIGV